MPKDFNCTFNTIRFDTHYQPAENTRLTTNFANLARGERREDNLRHTLQLINNRFNALAHWDNPTADRYSLELEIVTANLDVAGDGKAFPAIEMLNTTIVDHHHNKRLPGVVGNSFSSYVRDYDFSVLLLEHQQRGQGALPDGFGELHGKLFQYVLQSAAYQARFPKQPVICLSVSTSKTYHRTTNHHPILGVEYRQDDYSLTDAYFAKMGLRVRYFLPAGSVAPLAFYFSGDLLSDYSDLELISVISTMETFQKIYRPEIYNANSVAAKVYQPSLSHQDYSLTQIVYDRAERSELAVKQGKWTQAHFIKPYAAILQQWAARFNIAKPQQTHAA